MKKLLVVLSIVAFGFAFTSCKKVCDCKYNDGSRYSSPKGQNTKEECNTADALLKLYGEGKCTWK